MSTAFSVHTCEHGVYSVGPIPISVLKTMSELACSVLGCDPSDVVCDGVVAPALGASMAVTTREHAALWRAELGCEVSDA